MFRAWRNYLRYLELTEYKAENNTEHKDMKTDIHKDNIKSHKILEYTHVPSNLYSHDVLLCQPIHLPASITPQLAQLKSC